ncbi:hypothetical protein GCM10022254_59140 [Actinomadura meridiana]|uniref:Uncharacterized protein n=1 Tax=Actinomadura meridiana TaxID=559626 RepID=A0ABP8CHF1_9ACTN
MAVGAEGDHLNGVVASPGGAVCDVVHFKKWLAVPIHVIRLAGAQRVLALTTTSDQHGLDRARRAYGLLPVSG